MLPAISQANGVPEELDWERAAQQIERLAPASFPGLPRAVSADLERRGCTIPQTYISNEPHNAIAGSFRKIEQTDWAVLCSRQLRSELLIYWGGSADKVDVVVEPSADKIWLQTIGEEEIGFSRWISATGEASIRKYHAIYGGPELPPIDHQAINHAFAEKASSILYWHEGTWLELPGAD